MDVLKYHIIFGCVLPTDIQNIQYYVSCKQLVLNWIFWMFVENWVSAFLFADITAPTSCVYMKFMEIMSHSSMARWQHTIMRDEGKKEIYLKYEVILLPALSSGPSSSCINLSLTQQGSG